jgi:hypothetical protein
LEADGSAERVFDGLIGCDAVEAGGSDDESGEGVNVGAPEGPEAVGDLAEDDAGPERAFGAVVGGWDLAVGDEGKELAAPSLGLPPERSTGRGGHRHGDEAVEPSLGRGAVLRERGVLEVCSPTPDRDSPAEAAAECRGEGGLAGVDRVLQSWWVWARSCCAAQRSAIQNRGRCPAISASITSRPRDGRIRCSTAAAPQASPPAPQCGPRALGSAHLSPPGQTREIGPSHE